MKQYNTIEAYADHVGAVTAKQLAALCRGLGPTHPATVAIENLCTEAANIVNRAQMQQEQAAGADRYDLGALRVDTASASNSETGWERED